MLSTHDQYTLRQVSGSNLTDMSICEVYIGEIYRGAFLDITTEGIVSGRCGFTMRWSVMLVRQGGTNVAEMVANLERRQYNDGGVSTPPAITVTPNGNNALIKITFNANQTNSIFFHHIRVHGEKVKLKKY